MGWFGGSGPAKLSPVTELKQENDNKQKFLEDLPPKFDDSNQQKQPSPQEITYWSVLKQIKLSDFTVERFAKMPCFKEAMMTGFQAMAVLGGATLVIQRNVNRSVHWSVCGFLLGNILGWNQCRSIRKKQLETMDKARRVNREKVAKKWENEDDKDERLEQFKKVQEYYNNKKNN
ncbi:cytochrome c oxidase assembly protein Cox20p, mitochondrial [[Candida] jaroonii]|uniref:Cytochrome c oxidase assembly protein Cox20p, mitochondrial n=1 Tax=[Candida] jaroonii TaxID=467808 RepID=A0ACA9Y521_9ASCO|nr:cytochrome c oxidase assembly protein Cox20p, mitochondrial [[Candida] jaroonii]